MSYLLSPDFKLEVAKGNVAGHSIGRIVARRPASTSTTDFEDIWGGSGDLVWPTTAETLQVRSDNANDTALGTGARAILTQSLDDNLAPQNIITPLNGTTPVVLTSSHFRTNDIFVISSGSSQHNEGTITLEVSGGGAVRNIILPEISASQDGHYTVPAGFKAYSQQVITVLGFNESANFRTQNKSSTLADATEYISADFPVYQNVGVFETIVPFEIGGGFDFTVQAKANNLNAEINYAIEFILVQDGF